MPAGRWWFFCERCLKPVAGVGLACARCDHALLELCEECFAVHAREHPALPDAVQEFATDPKTETNGKPPKN